MERGRKERSQKEFGKINHLLIRKAAETERVINRKGQKRKKAFQTIPVKNRLLAPFYLAEILVVI
jgi:hypothetical protein